MKENTTYRIRRLTADQNLTQSNTTIQAINQLVATVDKSKDYKVRLTLLVIGKADSDIKATVTAPSGATGVFDLVTVNPGVGVIGTGQAVSLADDTLSTVIMEGVIKISTTAGSITAKASQNVSQADQLTIKAGSSLEIWQISDTT
jgi:hypothetical protein